MTLNLSFEKVTPCVDKALDYRTLWRLQHLREHWLRMVGRVMSQLHKNTEKDAGRAPDAPLGNGVIEVRYPTELLSRTVAESFQFDYKLSNDVVCALGICVLKE